MNKMKESEKKSEKINPETIQNLLVSHVNAAMVMWDVFASPGVESEKFKEARAKYEETVQTLLSTLGPKTPCRNIDVDLWGVYIERFLEEYGIPPSENVTFESVKSWYNLRLH